MAEKKIVDWVAVEVDYRAGIKSLKLIGQEYGVSDAGILKRAKRDGWTRDLSEKIKQKAEAKLAESVVHDKKVKVTEAVVVEANAQMQTDIILSHRRDIQRARHLTMQMVSELEVQTDNLDLLEELREFLQDPDDKGQDKRDELFRRVTSLSSRSAVMKTLADSLKSLVALEREAFGVDDKKGESGSGIEDLIKKVRGKENG